jgi:Ribose/xylose/arabinose/galactoside ABC-type transport systems, permease components
MTEKTSTIDVNKPRGLRKYQWEIFLVVLFLAVNVVNSFLSPYYLTLDTFVSTPMNFLDKAFLVLPMTMIIILGNIDVSVGSIVALTSVLMAVSYNAGLPMPLAMVLALVISTTCGLINGLLQIKFRELSATIITLSTMTVYRGIAYVILEDRSAGRFPSWFSFLAWGYIGKVPFILIVFALAAIVFAILLHTTRFGRMVFAVGNNKTACEYSGIRTGRIILGVSVITGLMAGFTSLFLTSRMGSTRPNVALGYELDVIAMTVLGGISTSGGKGRIAGPLISIFLIGFLNYGLGLRNVSAQVLLIILGFLLILSVLVQNFTDRPRQKSSSKSGKSAAPTHRSDAGSGSDIHGNSAQGG